MGSAIAFVVSFASLVFWLWSYVHIRLVVADIHVLEEFQGRNLNLSGNTVEANYRVIGALLRTAGRRAPTRLGAYIALYFWLLVFSSRLLKARTWVDVELQRILAFRAARYLEVCRELVSAAGATFNGVSEGLAWFSDSRTGSTLALPLNRMSRADVHNSLAACRSSFFYCKAPRH